MKSVQSVKSVVKKPPPYPAGSIQGSANPIMESTVKPFQKSWLGIAAAPPSSSDMDYTTYKIIHLIGVAALAIGLGGAIAGGGNRKLFSALQGIALLIMLVSGFGLLARLHLGFPHFAIVKVVLWVVIGLLPMLLRRLNLPIVAGICISLTLIAILAWLGVTKPALW